MMGIHQRYLNIIERKIKEDKGFEKASQTIELVRKGTDELNELGELMAQLNLDPTSLEVGP